MNLLAFSTLACPGWSIRTVITRAADMGYEGIEWRGGPEGHIQPGSPSSEKSNLRRWAEESGLKALAVTAYTGFVSALPEERQSNVDELRRYADLAAELGASYVRTFLGELPEGTNPDTETYNRISDSLNAVCEHAASVGVKIAVEPHDSFVRSADVLPVLAEAHPALRVIWDLGNTFAAGEEPAEGFELLRSRLAYIQVKDGHRRGSDWQLCGVGQGDVPLARAFELLLSSGYEGAFSVEWEYAWHPELDPPEIALPAARRYVKNLLTEIGSKQTAR